MATSKVVLNGTTIIDLTQDTVAASNLRSGFIAHNNAGTQITGAGSMVDSVNGQTGIVILDADDVGAMLELTVVNKTSSDTSQTLAVGTFYIWPEMSALTITCPATGGPYAFRFTSGSTATTLTMIGITMPDSFVVDANRVYEINILEGYGVATSWEVPSS